MSKLIEFKNVTKTYLAGNIAVNAIDNVSFDIDDGELVAILGASGAGKSTMLNLLGGMDKSTSGQIVVNNLDIASFNSKQLTKYRRECVGFVFQSYNLLSNMTVLENIRFGANLNKNHLDCVEVLKSVGLFERTGAFPIQLSGGEQQRVAIARAVAKNPQLLLCDEPTGALDYNTSKAVLNLICMINKQYRKTVILITHNTAIAELCDKVIKIKSGTIESVVVNPNPKTVEQIDW